MGNIDALRDWGHAKDYVRMQWLMLQQNISDDFVIATGVQLSVRQFIQWSAQELGFDIRFEGEGVNEIGIIDKVYDEMNASLQEGDVILRIDPRYFRPAEVESLLGDPSKAKNILGWVPEISAREMCSEMVREDLKMAKRNALLKSQNDDLNKSFGI